MSKLIRSARNWFFLIVLLSVIALSTTDDSRTYLEYQRYTDLLTELRNNTYSPFEYANGLVTSIYAEDDLVLPEGVVQVGISSPLEPTNLRLKSEVEDYKENLVGYFEKNSSGFYPEKLTDKDELERLMQIQYADRSFVPVFSLSVFADTLSSKYSLSLDTGFWVMTVIPLHADSTVLVTLVDYNYCVDPFTLDTNKVSGKVEKHPQDETLFLHADDTVRLATMLWVKVSRSYLEKEVELTHFDWGYPHLGYSNSTLDSLRSAKELWARIRTKGIDDAIDIAYAEQGRLSASVNVLNFTMGKFTAYFGFPFVILLLTLLLLNNLNQLFSQIQNSWDNQEEVRSSAFVLLSETMLSLILSFTLVIVLPFMAVLRVLELTGIESWHYWLFLPSLSLLSALAWHKGYSIARASGQLNIKMEIENTLLEDPETVE